MFDEGISELYNDAYEQTMSYENQKKYLQRNIKDIESVITDLKGRNISLGLFIGLTCLTETACLLFTHGALNSIIAMFMSGTAIIFTTTIINNRNRLRRLKDCLKYLKNRDRKLDMEEREKQLAETKSKDLVLENSFVKDVKKKEIESKISSLDESDINTSRKKELLCLYKENIDSFNEMYDNFELEGFLKKRKYKINEINYLLGEIEDTRTTEKAYQMKLSNN